jgi:hypothetical protein
MHKFYFVKMDILFPSSKQVFSLPCVRICGAGGQALFCRLSLSAKKKKRIEAMEKFDIFRLP